MLKGDVSATIQLLKKS